MRRLARQPVYSCKRAGRVDALPASISRGVFWTPGDDSLQGQIVLVRGLAEVGVEAVVADGQRVVVGAALLVLLLPDAAALDQLAARGAAEDAVWVDKPTRLFRKLLGETIRARTGRLVIDHDDPALTPTNQLRGNLIDFGYDARTASVVVTFDAVRDTNGTQVMTRRFSATVPVVTPEAGPVGAALNQAANDVAGQVADWVR